MRSAAKHAIGYAVNSVAGRNTLSLLLRFYEHRFISQRTASLIRLDILRSHARSMSRRSSLSPKSRFLHLGCGDRLVDGWLNVDLVDADNLVDLANGSLPWSDEFFDAVVCQHVIEHLELRSELTPLVAELYRVTAPGAEIWLSCPDLGKACNAYVQDKGRALLEDKMKRKSADADIGMNGVPSQHYINQLFDQGGEHKNLLDEELLKWLLCNAGFVDVTRRCEQDLLDRFAKFPRRGDDIHSIYVSAVKKASITVIDDGAD